MDVWRRATFTDRMDLAYFAGGGLVVPLPPR
jgi:hypothetical protein